MGVLELENRSNSSGEIENITFSDKGKSLISMYKDMATNGYDRISQVRAKDAYGDFELKLMKKTIKGIFERFEVESVLDYGSGKCDWNDTSFDDNGMSALQYFQLKHIRHYEPVREIDERSQVDCVISFDVLEHLFISDIPRVLYDMFSYAKKIIIINVACYPDEALLPNGENAHVTVRHPHWWKGILDCISVNFPDLHVLLFASLDRGKAHQFPIFSDSARNEDKRFVISF